MLSWAFQSRFVERELQSLVRHHLRRDREVPQAPRASCRSDRCVCGFSDTWRGFLVASQGVGTVNHHTERILGRGVGLMVALATLWSAAPAAAMPIYLEAGGQVVMEAELFTTRGPAADLPDGTAGGDAEQWLIITSESASSDPFTGARGEFLQVLDAGGIAGEGNFSDPEGVGPFVDYVMSITTTGTYEFFPRWDSPGSDRRTRGGVFALRRVTLAGLRRLINCRCTFHRPENLGRIVHRKRRAHAVQTQKSHIKLIKSLAAHGVLIGRDRSYVARWKTE